MILRYNFIVIFFFLMVLPLKSQILYPIYNPSDSTFTFSFSQSVDIAKTKKEKVLLEKEVKILNDLGGQHERVIKKMIYKDSLSQLEITHYETMNQILKTRVGNSEIIINNYQKSLDDLKVEWEKTKSELRREKFWKNMYKFGTPAVGALLFFILK